MEVGVCFPYILLVMTMPAVRRLRSTLPRGRKDQVWEPAVLLCGELPSLRNVFMCFNKGFPKIVPLTNRVTSVAGTSSIVACQQRRYYKKDLSAQVTLFPTDSTDCLCFCISPIRSSLLQVNSCLVARIIVFKCSSQLLSCCLYIRIIYYLLYPLYTL